MWQKYKLSEIGTIVGGATPSTKNDAYYGGDIPWLTPKDLSSFSERYIEKGERCITQEGLRSCSAKILPADSVLFSSRAPIGYVAIAKNDIATNQGFKSIIPNENINSLFLYYLLVYNKDRIEAMGSGTTFKEVSGATMKNIEVNLPPLEEQERIAKILGSLDDKIELNNKINRNLEAQAEALFKQWFVDFESISLSSIIDVRDGTHDSPKRVDRGKYLITSKHLMPNGTIDYSSAYQISNDDFEQINRRSEVCKYDILYSMIGTVGNILIVNSEDVNFAIKNVALIRTSNIVEYTYFLYLYLKSDCCKEYIQSRLAGSTQQYVTLGTLREMPIPHISNEQLCDFNKIIFPVFEKINNNREQNKHLIDLRDTLLPKLMNNEIKI